MKPFLLLVFLLPVRATAQALQGTLTDTRSGSTVPFAGYYLKGAGGPARGTSADGNGRFRFDGVAPGTYSLRFSAIGYRDTTFTGIRVGGDTTLRLFYADYCVYAAARQHKTCPACRRTDKVIPIRYGLPVSRTGKDPARGNGTRFLLAGCEVTGCDPAWYCRRDQTRF
ncbi:carboxypeptidase-like regulatory domain-containing protein [Flaviaesturariibacter amylovorans]|uniref:carboxypeptidase-like regulatory domain-containing protein n=1 Tax=Flaviaesturariibacter amylovorans TaxID=1084520 RepID=UPI0031EFDF59